MLICTKFFVPHYHVTSLPTWTSVFAHPSEITLLLYPNMREKVVSAQRVSREIFKSHTATNESANKMFWSVDSMPFFFISPPTRESKSHPCLKLTGKEAGNSLHTQQQSHEDTCSAENQSLKETAVLHIDARWNQPMGGV
jgi:hypothetical protein